MKALPLHTFISLSIFNIMARILCETLQLRGDQNCNDRGGILAAYYTEWDNIDWPTMLADPLLFDTANQQILGYAMNGGGVFSPIIGESKNSFYQFTYTSEQDYYDLLVTFAFKGQPLELRNNMQNAISCCNLVLHIYGRSGEQRVVGIDYDGEFFDPIVEYLRVGRHLDHGGQLGTRRSGHEVDFIGQSFFDPMFANVPREDIPLV